MTPHHLLGIRKLGTPRAWEAVALNMHELEREGPLGQMEVMQECPPGRGRRDGGVFVVILPLQTVLLHPKLH